MPKIHATKSKKKTPAPHVTKPKPQLKAKAKHLPDPLVGIDVEPSESTPTPPTSTPAPPPAPEEDTSTSTEPSAPAEDAKVPEPEPEPAPEPTVAPTEGAAPVPFVSDDPRQPSREPATSDNVPMPEINVTALTGINPCRKHGDHSRTRQPYTHDVAKVKEPNGTCNICWSFHHAVLYAQVPKAPQEGAAQAQPPLGAARIRRGRQ